MTVAGTSTCATSGFGMSDDEDNPLFPPRVDTWHRTPVPEAVSVRNLRCPSCSKLLAELVTRPFAFTCPRCKTSFSEL